MKPYEIHMKSVPYYTNRKTKAAMTELLCRRLSSRSLVFLCSFALELLHLRSLRLLGPTESVRLARILCPPKQLLIRRPGSACTVFFFLCRIQNLSQNPKSKIPKLQNPKSPKSKIPKIQNPQKPKSPKFGALGAAQKDLLHNGPKSKIPKIQNPQNPKSKIPKIQNPQDPKSKIRNPQIQNPKSPKSKIQNPQNPKYPKFGAT